jgi:C_GCAxxG_C_C family probable redox protein
METLMTPEETIAQVKKRAKHNFKSGLNCAESVLEAVLSHIDTGLPHAAMCVMSGFGGGGGLFGDTCGALAGALAALGAVYGRREIPVGHQEGREQMYGQPGLYRLFNRLPNEFKQRFGSTQCRALTSQWSKTWLCREHLSFCQNLTIFAAGLAAEMAVPKDLDRWGSLPFGAQHCPTDSWRR